MSTHALFAGHFTCQNEVSRVPVTGLGSFRFHVKPVGYIFKHSVAYAAESVFSRRVDRLKRSLALGI